MSDQQKSPLVNIAASIVATIKCCTSSDTETTTNVSDNIIHGDPVQTIKPLVKTTSDLSVDIVDEGNAPARAVEAKPSELA